MKKSLLLSALTAVLAVSAVNAQVTVTLTETPPPASVKVETVPLQSLVAAMQSNAREYPSSEASYVVEEAKVVIPAPAEAAEINIVPEGAQNAVEIFVQPGEQINVTVSSVNPLRYVASGTELMEKLSAVQAAASPYIEGYIASFNGDRNVMLQYYDGLQQVYSNFVSANPGSAAAPYVAAMLDEPKDAVLAFEGLDPAVQNSVIYPLANTLMESKRRAYAAEQKMEQMKGNPAPDFTLPDLEGKQVSLSDFRGKWVVIDFWGAWCKWCIKGFPELKEAYAKYDGKLEVIGVDCRDSDQAWREAVKRYELPWVQLFNGDSQTVLQEYSVRGFPTKAIVNPEGILEDIIVGEDPQFFTILDGLVK